MSHEVDLDRTDANDISASPLEGIEQEARYSAANDVSYESAKDQKQEVDIYESGQNEVAAESPD